jgi:hypothetical protein
VTSCLMFHSVFFVSLLHGACIRTVKVVSNAKIDALKDKSVFYILGLLALSLI